MKKFGLKFFVTLMVTILMAGVYGCKKKEGPLERAGKELDRAAEKTGDKLEKAGDKIKEAVK